MHVWICQFVFPGLKCHVFNVLNMARDCKMYIYIHLLRIFFGNMADTANTHLVILELEKLPLKLLYIMVVVLWIDVTLLRQNLLKPLWKKGTKRLKSNICSNKTLQVKSATVIFKDKSKCENKNLKSSTV